MTPDLIGHDWLKRTEEHDRQWSCNCSVFKISRRKRSDDVIVVVQQCQRCGRQIKTVPKKGQPILTLPWFDEALGESFRQARQAAWEKMRQEHKEHNEAAREAQNAQWWADYNRYLRSQDWHKMRKSVLERDNNTCQACLRNKATQVHHISYALYEQLGRSAAFELVAICYACHKAIHPHLAEAQHRLITNQFNPYLEVRNVR